MEKKNIVREKSFAFALRIVKAYQFLTESKREYVMSKQLLRSGTSVGANIEESLQGQSRADFISKLSIALKEAYETRFWILLLRDSCYFSQVEGTSLLSDINEIIRLLVAIIKSSKENNSKH
ncbi:MAG: four helix bundle protein [Candidatus Peribacteraceae bacterium]|nr:four helix bundle protein [Candidatus Peribacteraceae bacterium]